MDFAWRIPAVATPRFPLHRLTPAAAVLFLMAGAVLPALAGTPAGSAPPLGAVPPVAANGPGGGPGGPGWMAASDQRFIVMMIPHHRMGVMMASHALMGTDHPQLRALQEGMVRVQSQEIRQMADWYRC